MPNLVISADGGRYTDQQPTLIVPPGREIVFYVGDDEELSNEAGYEIFDQLIDAGVEPGGNVLERVRAGEGTYDYACWHAGDFPDHCGIYEVGNQARLDDLSGYSEKDPLWLSEILERYPNPVIYWLCCRTASPREEGLTNPADAYPGPRLEEADGQ
ncbi:MAG TPA: hypothetical protein VN179_03930 [Solirubrobacterales bacterium]|nr:hypothetical protein [Solirubrobacterales bacterium]